MWFNTICNWNHYENPNIEENFETLFLVSGHIILEEEEEEDLDP